jgi:hypothetical protein
MGLEIGSICIMTEVDGAADVHEPDGSEMDLCLHWMLIFEAGVPPVLD